MPTQNSHQNPPFEALSYRHSSENRIDGVILLAAGFSRRFGGVKLQAQLPNGRTILEECFRNISHATDNIVIVGRSALQEIGVYRFLPEQPGIKLVLSEDAASGMGHSLACAIKHIPGSWQSALVCLGDMPFIKSETLQAIMQASSEDTIVIPVWQSQRGHPVSFGRRYFTELTDSQGDTGGRHVVNMNKDHIRELQVSDQGIVQDIDTPETLACLVAAQ